MLVSDLASRAAAAGPAEPEGLVAVDHQLEVHRAAPLVAVVLDVLRPRFALNVDQDAS